MEQDNPLGQLSQSPGEEVNVIRSTTFLALSIDIRYFTGIDNTPVYFYSFVFVYLESKSLVFLPFI
jgi:hypothetical protein